MEMGSCPQRYPFAMKPKERPPAPNKYPFSTRVSSFYVAGDWEANTRPGMPNGSVSIPVDGIAVFHFLLNASSTGT
jgi:hypothetical protein